MSARCPRCLQPISSFAIGGEHGGYLAYGTAQERRWFCHPERGLEIDEKAAQPEELAALLSGELARYLRTPEAKKVVLAPNRSLRAFAERALRAGAAVLPVIDHEGRVLARPLGRDGVLIFTVAGEERLLDDVRLGRYPGRGRRICSWCKSDMGPIKGEVPSEFAGKNSHGLCATCERRLQGPCPQCGGTVLMPTRGGVPRGSCRCQHSQDRKAK